MYSSTTNHIRITVVPIYLEEQSEPDDHHYVWAYTISMENTGEQTVKLLNRYWHITDANGAVQEVNGAGVVGEHPVLGSGDQYQYTSGTALRTASGMMRGKYEMTTEDGESFFVDIPVFSLDSPTQYMRPN